jgi:hypothetical protein
LILAAAAVLVEIEEPVQEKSGAHRIKRKAKVPQSAAFL